MDAPVALLQVVRSLGADVASGTPKVVGSGFSEGSADPISGAMSRGAECREVRSSMLGGLAFIDPFGCTKAERMDSDSDNNHSIGVHRLSSCTISV